MPDKKICLTAEEYSSGRRWGAWWLDEKGEFGWSVWESGKGSAQQIQIQEGKADTAVEARKEIKSLLKG